MHSESSCFQFVEQSPSQNPPSASKFCSSISYQSLANQSGSNYDSEKHFKHKKIQKNQSKKFRLIKNKNKEVINQGVKTKYMVKIAKQFQKASENCKSINSYFRQPSNANRGQTPTKKITNNYQLTLKEAKFLTSILPKSYSLQDANQSFDNHMKCKQILKQQNLNYFVKPIKAKAENENNQPNEENTYSPAYYFIKKFINQMLEWKEIPKFFKQNIQEIMSFQSRRRMYLDYKKQVQEPLDLKTLNLMIDDERIQNYLAFKLKFSQMLIDCRNYHQKHNMNYILKGCEMLRYQLNKKEIQELCPDGNKYREDYISTVDLKKPKSKVVNADGQNKLVKFMDLQDPMNLHRFKVMNEFLFKLCETRQQMIEVVIQKLQLIISRYPFNSVLIIKNQLGSLSQKENKSRYTKAVNNQINDSSSRSSLGQRNNLVFYEIVPKFLEVGLFQQLKKLIRKQYRQNSVHYQRKAFDEKSIRELLYPRQDSEDFDELSFSQS